MSSISWHFEDVTLRMGGRERHWMGRLVSELAEVAVELRRPFESPKPAVAWSFREGTFGAAICTAWEMGSKPVKLAAYIHGFCETNTVIDGSAFPEVADTLEEGLKLGIFRPETQNYEGIEKIIERLRKGGNWCAWSYSVTDGFPRWADKDEESFDRRLLTAEESVALIRSEGNFVEKGFLDEPWFDGDKGPPKDSFWQMGIDEMVRLVCR